MKFASYRRTTRADNADQTHNYSSELSSGDLIGAVYMSFSTAFAEVDFGDSSEFRAAWSVGQIFQAGSTTNATLGVFRSSGSVRQSEININSEDNVGYVTTQRNSTTTQNFITINSIDHPNAAINVGQSAFSTSVSYHHSFWTGNSLDVEVNRSATINVLSTDLTFAHSTNINPDLAFVFINDPEIDNTHSGLAHVQWGVIDMKNISDRFFFNHGVALGALNYATILPNIDYMQSQGQPNPRFRIEPSSAAHGLTWTVRSTGGIGDRLSDTTAVAAAFVKVDSGYAAKAKYFRAPGTYDATGTVRSVQTNSIYLEFIQIMGTDAASLGANGENNNPGLKGGYGQGVWTISYGNAPIALGMSEDPTDEAQFTHDASSFGLRVRFGNGAASAFRYYAHSLVTGSGAFSFTEFVGSYGLNAYQFWVGVGKPIDAPSHLMDANSKSIFLADDSDYNDNLLLVGAAASPTSSTLKTGQWVGLWDGLNNLWTESYTNVGTPVFSFRLPPTTVSLNTWDAGIAYGVSFTAHSAGTSATGVYAQQDTVLVPDHKALLCDSGDHQLVDPANYADYRVNISSIGENQINFVEVDALGSQYAYSAATISGSVTAEVHLASTLVLSTGQSQIMSVGFQPDLIFVFMAQPENATDINSGLTRATRGFSYGFYDVRSSLGRFVGNTIIASLLGTPRDPWNTIVSTALSWPGGSVDLNAKFTISSVGANGFYINATEVTTVYGSVTETRPVYAAVKFNDPTIDFKVLDVTLPDSPGIQTFSLGFAPKLVYALGTNVKTLDYYYSPTTTSRNESFFQGFWSESDDTSGMMYYFEQSMSAQDVDYFQSNTSFGRLYGTAGRTILAEITSVTGTGSTNLQWNVSCLDATAANAFFPMLVIGVNENLGGPSSPPPPSSSGPAAGALFRSQPVTDNRDFPTPLTNVRAFPSD